MSYRRNRAKNPRLGDNGDGWAGAAQTGTVSTAFADVSASPSPRGETRAWQVTLSTGTPTYIEAVYAAAGDALVAPGETVTASLDIRGTATTIASVRAYVEFLDNAGTLIGTATGGSVVTTTSGTWKTVSATATAPAGTVRARVHGRALSSSTFASAVLQATALLIETGSAVLPYFRPTVTPGAFWDAAVEASTSTLYAFATPTVTTTTDPPTAHITMTGADLADNVATATLYELHDGTQRSVRTALGIFAVGGFAADDLELPRGTAVSYKAELFRADGVSLGFTPTTTVTIPSEVGIGYLSNPLDPATPAIRVEFRSTVGTGAKVDAPGQTYRVGLRTVALLAPRGLLQDVDLSFYTSTLDEYESVGQMVTDSNGLLLFRVDPPIALPRLVYFWAKGIMWDEFSRPAGLEDFEWNNVADQISPIDGSPLSSIIPWQIYIDAFPLWSDMNASYLSWLDAINNPPEA